MHAPISNRGRRYAGGQGGGTPPAAPFNLLTAIFTKLLDRIDAGLPEGAIEATLPDGSARLLGGRAHGPVAIVRLNSWRALSSLALGGSAGWYEAWARGDWSSPDPVPLFDLFMRNRVPLGETARASRLSNVARRVGHALRRNSRIGARRNIEYHYDLGNDFYTAWLDPGMTYSSALFLDPEHDTLEQAQQRKLDAMLARTAAEPGDTILEIGCGWGSFAETAARAGVKVHGITLSTEQKAFTDARMARQELGGVSVALTDYRDVSGAYDAIVSIEMVEAVGRRYWPDYLATIARALRLGGRAAIQFIAIDDAIFESYASNVDFIQEYVFPGGLLIGEREFRGIAEHLGLHWRDRQSFGLSYAETLQRWRRNFDAAVEQDRLAPEFDQGFIDLWRYYLMYCEGGFRGGGIDVVQVTLVKEG